MPRRTPKSEPALTARRPHHQRGHARQPRRNRRRRSAAAAAGNSRRIIGVVDRAERKIIAGPAIGKLVQIGLAEYDRAGRPQSRDRRRIFLRPKSPQRRRSSGGRIIAGVDAVLDRDRQAEQGAKLRTGTPFAITGARIVEHAVWFERDERVERAGRVAPREQRLGIALGGEFAARHLGDGLGSAELRQARGVRFARAGQR